MSRFAVLFQAMFFAATSTIDADVRALQQSAHMAGATVAIVKAGSVIYTQSFGQRDLASGLATDNDTKYETGSVTKQFTAVAILQLLEAGKLSLDASLATYLPTIPHAKDVTIRQLLTHTSGFPDYMTQSNIATRVQTPTTFDALIASIASKPLDFTPGAQFIHSNTNYLILGRVIEVASGEHWEHYAQEHLFAPAGLTNTSTITSEGHLSDMARGYTYAKGETAPSMPLDESWAPATGDIVTTVGDLVKWHGALASGQIISPSDYQLLTTTPRLADGSASNYGYGMYVSTFEGQPIVLSQGDTFGFDASDVYFPKQDVRVIVLANTEAAGGDGATGIAERVYSDLFPNQAATVSKSAPTAVALYTDTVQKMTHLPEPPFARYDMTIDAPGQHMSLLYLYNSPFLKLGGKGKSHLDSQAVYRDSDGRGAVTLDDGTFASTYYMGAYGGTWSTVHDWMRFGGDSAGSHNPTSQQREAAPPIPEIAVVSALNPGAYRVYDAGATQCASTAPGHAVHLVARSDPERHPLTDAAIDMQTGQFCMMRFTITSRHLKCAHMCSAIAELHFGESGGYTIITDGQLRIKWGAVGITTGTTILNLHFSNFTFPDHIDPQFFINPK